MVVIDTSAWIDYLRGADTPWANAVDDAMDNDRVIIGDLIIVELLQCIKNPNEYRQVEELVDSLEYKTFVGKDIAKKSAENYRTLLSKGLTVRKTIDMLIGTFCIENKIPLLHNDRDFDPMEEYLGLEVIKSI